MKSNCNICPRNCNADRKTICGFCGAPQNLKVAHVGLHFGEEPCISGTKGSGTIFFSHCNLKCIFCQNSILRDGVVGKEISVEYLVEIFKHLEQMDAHNINLVSGMHYANEIIAALKIYKPKIPIVWNTNSYEKPETLEKLAGLVDIYLADLKFYDSNLSTKTAKCSNYFSVASQAITKMRALIPNDEYDSNGIMKKGLIIRHLCLPNHTEDSIAIVDYITKHYPTTTVSLMSQYTPYDKAKETLDLNRKLKPIEYNKVLRHLQKAHKGQIYAQDFSSATEDQIPAWDISTV